jgi:hypothetical protein
VITSLPLDPRCADHTWLKSMDSLWKGSKAWGFMSYVFGTHSLECKEMVCGLSDCSI